MSKRTSRNPFVDELYISTEDYDRILMWSQSEKEINFICFGNDKTIKKVVRLSNIARFPQTHALWSENESKTLISEKKKEGLLVLAWGHSHPKASHPQHPSSIDVQCINNGKIELIAFPSQLKINGWIIQKNLNATLEHQISLIVV